MISHMAVQYSLPDHWIKYAPDEIMGELIDAKAAVLSLASIPYQRSWAEELKEMELKREIAGTSKIEGADFTDRELDEALSSSASQDEFTRSQRQARSAIQAYRWIEKLPVDRPIDVGLVKEIHTRIVTGCDEDHCPPGQLRGNGQNVVFGRPQHRGAEGGPECERALSRLMDAFNGDYRSHDPLVQALALHYHLGAMHPFYDGNGRTARALEALLLQRAHLKDTLFIAMSNYYYDEKDEYLSSLSKVRENGYNLTPFLKFGLIGIAKQCKRLLREIRLHVQKSLYRDVMGNMYGRLRSTRKRALAKRQCEILGKLIDNSSPIEFRKFYDHIEKHYSSLKDPFRGYIRDLNQLIRLKAISVKVDRTDAENAKFFISINLEWATEITETEFYKQINTLPEARTRLLVSP